MINMDRVSFLGLTLYAVMVFSITVLTEASRCDYAKTPSRNETVWKDQSENVTLSCPGYKTDTSRIQIVEYYWYKQEYDCKGLNRSNLIAYYGHHKGSTKEYVKHPNDMTISKTTGGITIGKLPFADEETLTCLFISRSDYVATVYLKAKEFEAPIFTSLPDSLLENEVKYSKCMVPKMHPATGFMEVKQDEEVITTVLINGSYSLVVPIPIQGKPKPTGNNLTCTAVQNVSGAERRLSASVQVTVLYSYHTRVVSSIPEQPLEFTNVTLTCEVTREGNPKEISGYIWLKDGQEETYGQALQLRYVTESDIGSYQCLITNRGDIMTPVEAAQKLQLDVVPLPCLPQPHFDSANIRLQRDYLQISWWTIYPCQKRQPDVELIIQVHTKNEIEKFDFQKTARISQKQVAIYRRFNVKLNHEVCLIVKKYPETKYCGNTKVDENQVPDDKINIAAIALYSVLGCVGLAAVIGITCCAVSSQCRRSKSQTNQFQEGRHENVGRFDGCTGLEQRAPDAGQNIFSTPSQSVNHYAESNLIGTELEGVCSSSLPTIPPPLPDTRLLTGIKPLDYCPENDQHYSNRIAIMSTIPRKPRYSVPKADSLGSLLEHCKDSYNVSQKEMEVTEGPSIQYDYVDMNGDAGCGPKIAFASLNNGLVPAWFSGSLSPHDKGSLTQLQDVIGASKHWLQLCKDSDSLSQDKFMTTEYMDMSGAAAVTEPCSDHLYNQ